MTVERIAELFHGPPSTNIKGRLSRHAPLILQHNLVPEDNFTNAERRHTLHVLGRNEGPGPDDISNHF